MFVLPFPNCPRLPSVSHPESCQGPAANMTATDLASLPRSLRNRQGRSRKPALPFFSPSRKPQIPLSLLRPGQTP